ncbi:MAG: hypothetical protein HFK04_00260 [Oscillospiraceae bacterium]|nr:hypothetical protein [Oscillospiraceae bacterium]
MKTAKICREGKTMDFCGTGILFGIKRKPATALWDMTVIRWLFLLAEKEN